MPRLRFRHVSNPGRSQRPRPPRSAPPPAGPRTPADGSSARSTRATAPWPTGGSSRRTRRTAAARARPSGTRRQPCAHPPRRPPADRPASASSGRPLLRPGPDDADTPMTYRTSPTSRTDRRRAAARRRAPGARARPGRRDPPHRCITTSRSSCTTTTRTTPMYPGIADTILTLSGRHTSCTPPITPPTCTGAASPQATHSVVFLPKLVRPGAHFGAAGAEQVSG